MKEHIYMHTLASVLAIAIYWHISSAYLLPDVGCYIGKGKGHDEPHQEIVVTFEDFVK